MAEVHDLLELVHGGLLVDFVGREEVLVVRVLQQLVLEHLDSLRQVPVPVDVAQSDGQCQLCSQNGFHEVDLVHRVPVAQLR